MKPHQQDYRQTPDINDLDDDIAWLEDNFKATDNASLHDQSRGQMIQKVQYAKGERVGTDEIIDEIQQNIETNRIYKRKQSVVKGEEVALVIRQKSMQSKVDIDVSQANILHEQTHPTKDGAQAFEFITGSTKKLLNYNEDNLEGYEPEKEHSQGAKYTRKGLLFIIFAGVLFQILLNSLLKYGTEKIQVVSTKMNNEFFYDMNEYPLKKLYPLHWFIEINREDVVDRMECVIHNKPEFCQKYDEKKCTLYDEKSEQYQDCMLRTQRKFGKDMKQFCIKHYEKSGIFSDKEKQKVQFYEQYHGCLQQAGQKKGKRYCDDILGYATSGVEQTDYFACYERLKVNIAEYGEQKCRYENPVSHDSQEQQDTQDQDQGAACESDNTVSDQYGDTCESWYDLYPDSCGEYDGGDFNFVAAESCCSCGGGTRSSVSGDPYEQCLRQLGLEEKALKYGCDSKNQTYDQHKYRFMCWPVTCTNDDSEVDAYGDSCSSWYDSNSHGCGTYDTETFQASQFCCACGGGLTSDGVIVFAGLGNTFTPVQNCQNDLSIQDAYGDTCAWYDDNADSCGDYDHDGFTASVACCVCGGGQQDTVQQVNDQVPGCQDFTNVTDSYGDGCDYYATDQSSCGLYDDDDFTASLVCCACGGGIDEISQTPSIDDAADTDTSNSSGESTPSCENLDIQLGITDSYGDGCDYYVTDQSSCGQYDDDDFTASLVCCACGGGTQEITLACEDDLSITDLYENNCTWYGENTAECDSYNDDDFTASVACCACKSDSNRRRLSETLINDDYYTDSLGRTCSEYYTDSSRCGGFFDTEKFQASQMCVECGGGIAPLATYCDQTKNIIDERKSCYQSIEQTKNTGYCDSDILTSSSQPTTQNFFECYSGVGINTTDLTLCDNLYPIDDKKIGGSFKLLQCYEAFGITITKSDMHEKCSQIYKDNMYERVEAYHQCLIDLGSQKTADVCLLDPYKMILSQDERKMFIVNFDEFNDCQEEARVQKEAYQCMQKYESDQYFYGYGDKDELRACFEQYYMPLSPVFDCKLKFQPDQDRNYQVKEDYDKELPENCRYFYDGKCQYHYDDAGCEEEYYYAEYYYDFGYSDQDPHEYMNEYLGNVCEPFVPDYTAQNQCIEEIDYELAKEQLNQKLETYLRDVKQLGDSLEYQKFTNNTVYCDTVFDNQAEVESKFLCYEMVEQPVGPEKCFELPRVLNNELYHYNFFYKYLCLWLEYVELDVEANGCLDIETLDELNIKQRDDCLKDYESKIMPVMEREGPLFLYLQPPITEDDEEDLTRIYDKPTDVTAEEIQQFVCDSIRGLFTSSPYQEIQDKRNKQVNQIIFQMNCEVFQYANITRDNIVVHFSFNESESFKNQDGKSFYKDDFNPKGVVVNRTDSNQQMLNLTFANELNLIQILSNKLYHYKSEINDTKPGLNFTIEDEASYIKFFSDSRTTKIFETYSQIVSQQLIPSQNLLGHQTLVSKVDKNVTKDIFGVPWKLDDLNFISVELQKIHSKIKVIEKSNLVKEEILRINTFIINLNTDFIETVIRIHYYTVLDVFSELGGLFASYNSILGSIGFVFLISYFYSLSGMIHRKYVHKIDIQQVKQFQSLVRSQIIDEIKQKIATSHSGSGGQQLVMDLEECERVIQDDFKETYDATDKRLEDITQIVQKYRPEAMADIFEYNQQGHSEWDKIEHLENQEKRKIYVDRVKMPLSQIVKQIHSRMSFYNIYKLIDNIEANKIKIRKIKYTTRLEMKEIEALKETVEVQQEEIKKQDERIKVLEEMVKMMNNSKLGDYNNILSGKKTKKQYS